MNFAKKAMIVILGIWLLAVPLSASAFALRTLEKGGKVPDIEYSGISGEGGRLSSFCGEKGVVVIYWATWSSRSPAILKFAERELRKYEKDGLRFLAVNADHQEMKAEDFAAVKAMAAETGITFPVVHDTGLKGYNEIGIISTPTTLIIGRDLTIVDAYPGFPSVARDDLPERIEAHLGIAREKRPEKTQYLLDHRPKNYALQYYNLGRQMFLLERSPSGALKAVPETAIERLDEAIRRDPDFFRPYLLKAIIYDLANDNVRREAALDVLRKRDFQEAYEQRAVGLGYLLLGMDAPAADLLGLVTAVVPDDPPALFGQAVAASRRGDGAGALKALGGLSRSPKAKETLGFDPAAPFDGSGRLRPGTEGAVRAGVEKLLDIGKP